MSQKLNSMLRTNNSYKHTSRDPMIALFLEVARVNGLTLQHISAQSGISLQTLYNWKNGATRRPQRLTLEFALRACGYSMGVQKIA